MCLIKQPLCSWINLSQGLSYGPVSLFIILALSDKKIHKKLHQHSPVPLKMPCAVCMCLCALVMR